MAGTAGGEQCPESPRVADRVGVAVVVEVDEHVLAGQVPFPDPVSPPPQVGVGVGTRNTPGMSSATPPQAGPDQKRTTAP